MTGQWRVGSMSMGLMLILIGGTMAASVWLRMDAYRSLATLLPAVFILLGVELLAYLRLAGRGDAAVKYDWLSLFFVGAVAVFCLGLTLVGSTGLLDEVRFTVRAVERTDAIAPVKREVPPEIGKIVVDAYVPVHLDRTPLRDLHVFGHVRHATDERSDAAARIHEDYVNVYTVGDTMYVLVRDVDRKLGLTRSPADIRLTLVVPQDIPVETRGFQLRDDGIKP